MATKAAKGFGFFRKLWHEKPDIAASSLLIVIGAASVARYCFIYDKVTYHKHRWEYTVIREEDADPEYREKNAYN